MIRRTILGAGLILGVGLLWLLVRSWEPVNRLPDDPDHLILFSIDGSSYFKNEGSLPAESAKGELLYGIPVLGRVEISDHSQRQDIIMLVKQAIRNPFEPEAKCFIPRHLIRTIKNGKAIDLLICFQCKNYEMYPSEYGSGKLGKDRIGRGRISSSIQSSLNKILTDSNVPLAQN